MYTPLIKKAPKKKFSKKKMFLLLLITLFLIYLTAAMVGFWKPLPEGISFEGELHSSDSVEFLMDVTYEDNGIQVHEQEIFSTIHSVIENATDFIIVDMFLFNDEYDRSASYPSISSQLTDTLLAKKAQQPDIEIVVITDPINTFYGSYSSSSIERLREANIHVFYTDLTKLRDSNPTYSGLWRSGLQWFGNSENGWLPNPFSPDSPQGTLRSYLQLFNFKANHRKVVITEHKAVVTSANPHDASGYHSNIAFVVQGDIVADLIETEKAVAVMSGASPELFASFIPKASSTPTETPYQVQVLTEGKIKKSLLDEIEQTKSGDTISIGAFYFSDRDLVRELLSAAKRDVEIRLLFDANKDAFGREKNGVPNRPVAHELVSKSDGDIAVRWYNTSGEQYHTKMAIFEKEEEVVVIGGSSNFTKRNLADFNLETNLKVVGSPEAETLSKISMYFEKLWTNDGQEYTLEYEDFADDSFTNKLLYRFQEWSGLSTF
ncbi:phospholipase D family protein [Bacillus alkalicellulosilyticus]|uniref:phospholipase D family protein n=1 Tax=Alkalihalobacterium alkalicellulosilyticum TaxID=1912214 RepID=UPI0009968285|nr:phospholipase D family protein [Bacillus alkalicellulosilyticus]